MKRIDYDFIKNRRESKGLSMQYVAQELGFKNASTYFKYEIGEYLIKADMLPKLSQLFECKIENFFTD